MYSDWALVVEALVVEVVQWITLLVKMPPDDASKRRLHYNHLSYDYTASPQHFNLQNFMFEGL